MTSFQFRINRFLASFILVATFALYLFASIPTCFAVDDKITKDTDLSQMDWSDNPKEDNTDLSKMDWSDDPKAEATDLSKESWEDGTADSTQQQEDLSGMSWSDDESSKQDLASDPYGKELSVSEESAIEGRERKIHIYGSLLFFGYILGGLLTAYFTRKRKLANHYPPELLIVLHTLWPIEWIFVLFAGKKVR